MAKRLSEKERRTFVDAMINLIGEGCSVPQALRKLPDDMPKTSANAYWASLKSLNMVDAHRDAMEVTIWRDVDRIGEIAGDKMREAKCRQVEINSIQWKAEKLAPKVFGHKTQVEANVQTTVLDRSSADLEKQLIATLADMPTDTLGPLLESAGYTRIVKSDTKLIEA